MTTTPDSLRRIQHSFYWLGVLLTGAYLALLATPLTAYAEVDSSIVGVEKKPYKPVILTAPPLPASEQAQLLKKLDAIRAALRATPALRDLRGYDWQTYATIKGAEKAPIVAVLGYIVHPYTIYKNRPTVSSGEGPGLKIHINDVEQMLSNQQYNVDQDARFTTEPKVTGELAGLPIYANRFVFISKRGQSPFIAVTQQQFLDQRIKTARQEIAEMQQSFAGIPGDSKAIAERAKFMGNFTGRLKALEEELAGLSAEDRGADAYLNSSGKARPSGLAPLGTTHGERIMTPNPALYDARLPRAAIQNIVIGTPQYFPELYGLVQQQIDKQVLLGLID